MCLLLIWIHLGPLSAPSNHELPREGARLSRQEGGTRVKVLGKANFFFSFNELDFVSLNEHHVERIMWEIENPDIHI